MPVKVLQHKLYCYEQYGAFFRKITIILDGHPYQKNLCWWFIGVNCPGWFDQLLFNLWQSRRSYAYVWSTGIGSESVWKIDKSNKAHEFVWAVSAWQVHSSAHSDRYSLAELYLSHNRLAFTQQFWREISEVTLTLNSDVSRKLILTNYKRLIATVDLDSSLLTRKKPWKKFVSFTTTKSTTKQWVS